jgi:hypothetical protein
MDAMREELKRQPDGQLSQTDADSRSMISQAKGTGVVGYNVQAAVDTKQHLIVAHEVTNVGNDRAQLTKMAIAARDAIDKRRLQALADRGYFSGPEIKACTEAGITPRTNGIRFLCGTKSTTYSDIPRPPTRFHAALAKSGSSGISSIADIQCTNCSCAHKNSVTAISVASASSGRAPANP